MKIDIFNLQKGTEKNFGIWGTSQREFRLSIRWNKEHKIYELYKLFLDTNEELILFSSKELVEIVIRACVLANDYEKDIMNELV
ncbi:MAG: hypothetical protein ACFFCM_01675 [Promethearchaeota archaeon]